MKRLIIVLLFLTPFLHADYTLEPYSKSLQQKHIPIVDIRTVGEWKESGVIKGAIAIEFFNEQGQYNIPKFLKALQANVDTSKPFALICHTGSRSKMVASFLSDELKYKVIDIKGGMEAATKAHAPIVPYKSK